MTSEDEAKSLIEEYRAATKTKKKDSDLKVGALLRRVTTSKPAKEAARISKKGTMRMELHGFSFACRIELGSESVAISNTIINFPGYKGIFPPTMHVAAKFKSVEGNPIL